MPPPPRRPSPGFRLNAPQAESQAENGSGEFAGLGDEIEPVHHNNAFGAAAEQSPQKPPRTSLTLEEQRQILLQQQLAAAAANNNSVNTYATTSPQPQAAYATPPPSPSFPYKCLIVLGMIIILLLLGLIVTVVLVLGGDENDSGANKNDASNNGLVPTVPTTALPPSISPMIMATPSPTTVEESSNQSPTPFPSTTLGRIRQRGRLLCGVAEEQPGFSQRIFSSDAQEETRIGIDAELCRAVAAAIFGINEEENDDQHVEFVTMTAFDRFTELAKDAYDVLLHTTTHTMERNLYEPTTQQGFAFSVPYLYNGLQLGGADPAVVMCAENSTLTGGQACSEEDLVICVQDGTTHVDVLTQLLPGVPLIAAIDLETMVQNFADGFCNVVAGEQYSIAESVLRQQGYNGEYALGDLLHSKEPLCLVTRNDDVEWSDFVNWVLQSLLTAEEEGITQTTANIIDPTDVFGDLYRLAFRNAVRAVGNFAEIYQRTLEPILPRPSINQINVGDSGLIHSHPFGSLIGVGSGSTDGGTLTAIQNRGFLKCGISTRVIFANFDETSQEWDGFDVDYCKALSAAIFNGVTNTIEYIDLSASERFIALESGDVDVLSRLTTVTLARDVLEPATNVGFSFSQPNFYDGLLFGGIPPFAGCADRLDVTSVSCRDILICVNQGTTFESRVKSLFPERFVVPQPSGQSTVEGLVNGDCNVIAGGVVDVSLTNVRNAGYDGLFQTGNNRFSKDPLALVTRQDDPDWSYFVYWVVAATFHAEEEGITQATASEMPRVTLFGLEYADMFRDAIGAVGNYGEIYERQAQVDVPRGGLNELNELLTGPQHYPLPGAL